MISNELVQAGLIEKLKSLSSITLYVPVAERREFYWQGDTFTYPNIRLDLETLDYIGYQDMCNHAETSFSIYVYSEERSSKQANTIAGLLVNDLKGKNFIATNGLKYVFIRISENIPAIREDERTWRAQIRCQTLIHETS